MSSRPALGPTQPSIQWVPGALSPVVKRQGREVDHSTLTSAEVKKNVDLYINSTIRLHVVVLNYVKHKANFIFTYNMLLKILLCALYTSPLHIIINASHPIAPVSFLGVKVAKNVWLTTSCSKTLQPWPFRHFPFCPVKYSPDLLEVLMPWPRKGGPCSRASYTPSRLGA
jgi:hypothetical protein